MAIPEGAETVLDRLLDRVPLSTSMEDSQDGGVSPPPDLRDELRRVVELAIDGTPRRVVERAYFVHCPGVEHKDILGIYARLFGLSAERVRQCFRMVSDRAMKLIAKGEFPALERIRYMVIRRQAVAVSTIASAIGCREEDFNWASVAYLLRLHYSRAPIPMVTTLNLEMKGNTRIDYDVTCVSEISVSVGRDALLGILDVVEHEGEYWLLPIRTFSRMEVRLIRLLGTTKHRQLDLAHFHSLTTGRATESLGQVPIEILSELLTRCQSKLGYWTQAKQTVALSRPYRFHDGRLFENVPGAADLWLTSKDLVTRHIFGGDTSMKVTEAAWRADQSQRWTHNFFYANIGCYIEHGTIIRYGHEIENDLIDLTKVPPIAIEAQIPPNEIVVDESVFDVGPPIGAGSDSEDDERSSRSRQLIHYGRRSLGKFLSSRLLPPGTKVVLRSSEEVCIVVDRGHYVRPDERFDVGEGRVFGVDDFEELALKESETPAPILSMAEAVFVLQCHDAGCRVVPPLAVDGVAADAPLSLTPEQESKAITARLEWLKKERFGRAELTVPHLRRLDKLIQTETQRASTLARFARIMARDASAAS